MAKRKKYPKLPNGFGSIKYLGKGRRNPYGVYPPTTEFSDNGVPKTPKAICYVDAWTKGLAVLTAYMAGRYSPGMERTLEVQNTASGDAIIQSILADYNQSRRRAPNSKTFQDVYEEFYDWKYNQINGKKYSDSARNSTTAAFKNCKSIHNRAFAELRYNDLQKVINDCKLKYSSLELILSLFHQMYSYAEIQEIVDKDHSAHVKINIEDDDEHGVPFSDDDLKKLWADRVNPVAEMLIIMCYSGFRIQEYKKMEVNTDEWYFHSGVKTTAGKNRIVPIHSGIQGLVKERLGRYGVLLKETPTTFRKSMYRYLALNDIERHTPHDCRHTFSALCERYKVSENDRKRMLGHSFQDVTNNVYGHRTLDDLRQEIEKIHICY